MNTTQFSHVRPQDTDYQEQGFFLYRDLGIADATNGSVVMQLVKAHKPPGNGTSWHYHDADFHVVYMLKGWARFMYGDTNTLVQAGDVVHQRPGIVHFLFDYSPDMEFLEVIGPANFGTMDVDGPDDVSMPSTWGG